MEPREGAVVESSVERGRVAPNLRGAFDGRGLQFDLPLPPRTESHQIIGDGRTLTTTAAQVRPGDDAAHVGDQLRELRGGRSFETDAILRRLQCTQHERAPIHQYR